MLAEGIYSKIYFSTPSAHAELQASLSRTAWPRSKAFGLLSYPEGPGRLASLFSKALRYVTELPPRRSLYVSQHDFSKFDNTLLARARPPGEKND